MRVRCQIFLVAAAFGVTISNATLAESSFRGLWVDAFHPGIKSPAQINDLVQRATTGNYNAIIVEVLAYQDNTGVGHGAYWSSETVPMATDIQGSFDPLAQLCAEAHAAGIEVHAWIVPFRVSSQWPPSGNGLLASHPEWLMVPSADMGSIAPVRGSYVLDPGSPDAQAYVFELIHEIIDHYSIDGINLDYVRYTQTDAGYPADLTYTNSGLARFQAITGYAGIPPTYEPGWNAFRRRTINELIKRCHAEIVSASSPNSACLRLTADVLATGNAPAQFESSLAYSYFQDWRHWMEQGWLDAAILMNYKREHCASQAQWSRNWIVAGLQWRYDRHVFMGQASYLNSMANSVDQIECGLAQGVDGIASYSYFATRADEAICDGHDNCVNDWTWYDYVADEVFDSPATLPSLPWRDPATAMQGSIWGRVTEATTGQAVDGATVHVGAHAAVQTDGNGYYVATLMPAAHGVTTYPLSIFKTGFSDAQHPSAAILPAGITRYDFALGGAPPRMVSSPSELVRAVELGHSASPDEFAIWATEVDYRQPVNYLIDVEADWLSVHPIQGTSRGEVDLVTVEYDLQHLPIGTYETAIVMSDAAAINSPVYLPVVLEITPETVPGDSDGDSDVDQTDFGRFQACLGVTSMDQRPACLWANLDGDSDIDSFDLSLFRNCLSGASIPGDPDCLGF